MRFPIPALVLCLTACSDPQAGAESPAPSGDPAARQDLSPLTLEHDFGTVPHGESRTHEFELDLARLGEPFVPLRVHLECSCGRADLRLRREDGSERFVDNTGMAYNLPVAGERLILHVELDTAKKEAVDLPATTSLGYVMLQQLSDPNGMGRLRWPFRLRFGIDAPVALQPFAALDFGSVAASQEAIVVTTLRGDEAHPDVRFGPAESSDPSIEVALEPGPDHTVLRARCRPGEPGNHRALVTVDTDLPGYRVAMQATWKVVPDLEATPVAKISLTAVLEQAQDEGAALRQFVLVTDHDTRRSPEFVVRRIVGADGEDASSHFEASLSKVASSARQQRLAVRYLGGLHQPFRGRIELGKPDAATAVLPIDLVVFPQKQP